MRNQTEVSDRETERQAEIETDKKLKAIRGKRL